MSSSTVEKWTRGNLLTTIAASLSGAVIMAGMLGRRSILDLVVYPIIASVVTALMLLVIVARDRIVRSVAWSDDERFRDVDELAARRGVTVVHGTAGEDLKPGDLVISRDLAQKIADEIIEDHRRAPTFFRSIDQ